jgi:hypothetical protein
MQALLRPGPYRTIALLCLFWFVGLVAFQGLVSARLGLIRPDRALIWTADETMAHSQRGKPTLLDPFMNAHVAWDSEFYLSIALNGYDDEAVRAIGPADEPVSLNYAFMPFYPLVTRLVALPLGVLGLTPIATATLAAVLVSALGTLVAMLALYDLTAGDLGEAGGLRAAFYLVAFPSGFFLAQVYTEGLFVGLAFSCLALIRRKHFLWAALAGALAAWTRAVGIALLIPLVLPWIQNGDWTALDLEWRQVYLQGLPWRAMGRGLLAVAPLAAFAVWRMSPWGTGFEFIEENYFGRGFLSLGNTYANWSQAFRSLWGENRQAAAYYAIEFGAIVLGFVACFATWRRYPGLAAFSLAVVVLSFTSGPAQGMHRYILGAPAVFVALAQWGRHPAFDRGWTIFSVLLMGMLATLFTFNMWTG